jgi:HSP20 family protein
VRNNDEDKNNIFSLFTGLDKLINVVADMVDKEQEEVKINGDIKPDHRKKVTGKYGFSIMLGPDNQGSFSTLDFDKMNSKESKPRKATPVTDIFQEEDKVLIVAELPGVVKNDIELSRNKNIITITAANQDTLYTKQVELDFVPEHSSIQESFANYIYSISIEKSTAAGPKE